MRLLTLPSDLPFNTKPPVGSIVILERPLLKPEPVVGPNSRFFWMFWSWEAEIKAKSSLSPSFRVPPGVTVRLNCVLLEGQFVGPAPPATKVQSSPLGEEDAVTCHRVSALL